MIKQYIKENFIPLFIAVIYLAFFSYVSYLKFNSYTYGDFDLAVHTQSIWNILHGSLQSSILRTVFLGNHMSVILFLIAPIYLIFPSALTLLFLQTLAIALAGFGIYLIAKKIIGSQWGLVISFIYFMYPATGYMNLYEFHPTTLATCFLVFMYYFFLQNRIFIFYSFLILALLCQENVALIIMFFSIFCLIQKRRLDLNYCIVPLLLSLSYFLLSILLIMPMFNKGNIGLINVYVHFGSSYAAIIKNLFTHPLHALTFMLSKQKLLYVLQILGPLSFLSLLAPGFLLPALPLFLQHLLSSRQSEATIYFHYQAELLPFIFMAAIYGLKRALNSKLINKFVNILSIIFIFVAVSFNLYSGPFMQTIGNVHTVFQKDSRDFLKDEFIKLIPKNASVTATFEFLPKLANRKKLYSFHHIYSGFYTLSNKKYDVPEDLQYALIDFNDYLTFVGFRNPRGEKNLQEFFNKFKWKIIGNVDDILLLQRIDL